MNLLDRIDQICQTFKGKIFALHGHDHAMRRTQTIQGEHGQRRRAINQDKIKIFVDHFQSRLQALIAPFKVNQFDLGTRQFTVGTQHVIAAFF